MANEHATKNVAVIGLWHLGLVNAACLAGLGNKVTCIDIGGKVFAEFDKGRAPLHEPGLMELIVKCRADGNLLSATDYKTGLAGADYVIVAFDTPVDADDKADITPVVQSIYDAIPYLKQDCLLIISSQVPVGTCDTLKAKIKAERPDLNFGITCIPENLRLGDALSRYRSPDVLAIGADSEADWSKAEALFEFVDKSKVKRVGLKTAEMVKHSINTFLASQITLSNQLGNLSDALGISWDDVADVLRLEPRIGKKALLKAGLGFAGGTLARDVNVLRQLGNDSQVDTALLDAIMLSNKNQNDAIVSKVARRCGSLKGLKVGVLGLTYKPETSTIRRSASIEIIQKLVASGAVVRAYDPKAEFSEEEAAVKFERVGDAYLAAESADALLILTAWPEFKELDVAKIKAKMNRPVIVDAINILMVR